MASRPTAAALSAELQRLHRLLLRAEANALGLSADPYKLMAAAMGDARLAWLMPLIKLIAALDAADEAGEIADAAARAAWRERIEALVGPAPGAEYFAARLGAHATALREVAASEAALRALLAGWARVGH